MKQATPASVSVEVGGQTIMFEDNEMRAIYLGEAPAPAAQQPSARDDAMKALKALRSVSQGDITYRDYAPRVSDAKIAVDRSLGEAQDAPKRSAISETTEYYSYAASAWNSSISRSGCEAVGASPLVQRCKALSAELDRSKREESHLWRNTSASMQTATVGIVIGNGAAPIIWPCSADKLSEAEKLLGTAK